MYSYTLSLSLALDRGGWSTSHFTPGNDPVSIYRRLDGSQDRAERMRKISPPPGFDPRTVQSVPSRYTDRAIPAHAVLHNGRLFLSFRAPSIPLHVITGVEVARGVKLTAPCSAEVKSALGCALFRDRDTLTSTVLVLLCLVYDKYTA